MPRYPVLQPLEPFTPEQQRVRDLFKGQQPYANFSPQGPGFSSIAQAPAAWTDQRQGLPYADYTPQTQSFKVDTKQNTNYQDAIRGRLSDITQFGAQALQNIVQRAQRNAAAQQAAAAQQSYGSNYGPPQFAQYGLHGNLNAHPNSGAAMRQRVLAAIAKQRGVPYSWGGGGLYGPTRGIGRGASTVGFDCSGLTRYAYAQVGISLPRLAEQQATIGRRAPISSLRPGDLVAGPHHIAVYAGNGKMWEAPYTGGYVRLTPVRSGMTGVMLNYHRLKR